MARLGELFEILIAVRTTGIFFKTNGFLGSLFGFFVCFFSFFRSSFVGSRSVGDGGNGVFLSDGSQG